MLALPGRQPSMTVTFDVNAPFIVDPLTGLFLRTNVHRVLGPSQLLPHHQTHPEGLRR